MEQHSGDIPELTSREIELKPELLGQEGAFHRFCRRLARNLDGAKGDRRVEIIESARDEVQTLAAAPINKPKLALTFASSVVLDVLAQGWNLKQSQTKTRISTPDFQTETPEEAKARIRAGHLLERNEQLRERSVADFIRTMEQRRLGPTGWVSIFSLMRDGRELEAKLRITAQEPSESKRAEILRSVISPYLQLVEPDVTCEHTGLKLNDIWRYFRHTWVSTYKTLPGRSMTVLIRDAAAPNHPVIGIAALGSSMAQQTLRDQWIGWDSDTFIQNLTAKPTAKWCKWVHVSLRRLLASLYQKDLAADGFITPALLKHPTVEAIEKLRAEALRCAKLHQQFPDAADHKRSTNGNGLGDTDWQKQARTDLFRSKRAKTLAVLLGIRRNLRAIKLAKNSSESLRQALNDPHTRHALRQLVRLVKAEHVGVDMMDIIICGAVAPYGALLGGKLVCVLLASPEVVNFYSKRYGDKPSIIASSMKGKAVVRVPNLVLLATTSLYAVGSSQYNRIRVPLEQVGGKPGQSLSYHEIGMSLGFGSYHFSAASLGYLNAFIPRGDKGRKVNSIFGEGVNPLMRKLRDGLAKIQLPADELLKHGNPRPVYGVALAENFREVLLGLDTKPKYLLPRKRARHHTDALAEFWRRRWVAGRITRPGILEQVAQHTQSYPITHGARVQLPADHNGDFFPNHK
jgi:Domain of unknown function (DUF4338)